MSGQGRNMLGTSRGNSATAVRTTSPREVYSGSVSESASHDNPFQTFAPGVMTHDGAFADPTGGPSFEEEAANFNAGRGFSDLPAKSLGLREQAQTIFEAPSIGAEQTGLFTPNAQVQRSSGIRKSGDIFNGPEHTRQQKLAQLRKEHNIPQNETVAAPTAPVSQELSTVTRSAAEYDAHSIARIEQLRQSVRQERRAKKLSVVSGDKQLTSTKLREKNSATFTLIENVQRFVFGEARRKSALEMYVARSSKKAARKSPGLDMGGQESRGDAVAEMQRKSERRAVLEAGHERDLQAD